MFVCFSLHFIILTTRYTCWLRWEGTPIRPSMCSPVLRGNDRQSCTDQYVCFSGKVPFGKLTFCFGKSQFSMGKSIINHHVQKLCNKLPEGISGVGFYVLIEHHPTGISLSSPRNTFLSEDIYIHLPSPVWETMFLVAAPVRGCFTLGWGGARTSLHLQK